MQTIFTKYIAATNTKPSRIRATASHNKSSVTIPYCYESYDHGHSSAALALAVKLGWKGTLITGHTKDGQVFVFANGDSYDLPV